MSAEPRDLYRVLSETGERFPRLGRWLIDKVWGGGATHERLSADFLLDGEEKVNRLEALVAAAAPRAYDELCFPPAEERDLLHFLLNSRPCAAVVFDGMSLREMPAVLALAEGSHLRVLEAGFSVAAIPSDTNSFITERLKLPNTSPSQLPERRPWRELGVRAYYFTHPTQQHSLDTAQPALLLWSAFPDNTYKDSGARFPNHFAEIQSRLEIAWRFTVQQIPRDRRIVVTSDHGYIFFGPGLSATRHNDEIRPLTRLLAGERFKFLDNGEAAIEHPDLVVRQAATGQRVAVIRGRVQTHPPGDAANKLYKHGGLSLMEMLVPWIELQAEG